MQIKETRFGIVQNVKQLFLRNIFWISIIEALPYSCPVGTRRPVPSVMYNIYL